MAVSIHNKYQFLKKIGCISNLDLLSVNKVKVQLGFKTLTFISEETDKTLFTLPLPVSSNELMKPYAPAGMKKHLAEQVDSFIMGLSDKKVAEAFVEAKLEAPEWTAPKPSPLKKKIPPKAPTPTPTLDGSLDSLLGSTPVPLLQADKLYQPVKGTSDGSRYFMVARNDKFRVAVRVQGTSVSIRLEGLLTSEQVTKASLLGIKKAKDGMGHLSGHYNCENTTPQRLVGAVLSDLSAAFDTPIPNINYIINKGA